jgi:hypothetical protein
MSGNRCLQIPTTTDYVNWPGPICRRFKLFIPVPRHFTRGLHKIAQHFCTLLHRCLMCAWDEVYVFYFPQPSNGNLRIGSGGDDVGPIAENVMEVIG